MCVLLSKLGATCTVADDGLEAVQLYKDNKYDLVLMDINMPRLDGVAATQSILESQRENGLYKIPIIALTANNITGDKEKYLNYGMNDYISKPIIFDELYKVIERNVFLDKNKILKKDDANEVIIDKKDESKIDNSLVHINTKKYNKSDAIRQLGLDEVTVDMLLDDFFLTLDDDIEKIKFAIDSKKSEDIRAAAHYLKSSCVNFAMNEANDILKDIETRAKYGETENFDILKLKQIFEDMKIIIKVNNKQKQESEGELND